VSRLEERGLVVRLDCPTDRRGQIAQLTEQGFAVLDEAAHGHVDQVRRSVIDVLTPEQVAQLGEISAKLVGAATGRVITSCAEAAAAAADAEAGSGCFGAEGEDDGTCPG
jgi:hypothetical protein